MLRLLTTGWIAGLLPMLALAASAAEKQFPLLPDRGVVPGKTIRVDAAFAKKFAIDVVAPFEIRVPEARDIVELVNPAPKPGNAYLKINFATGDKKLIENIQFGPMKVAMGAEEDRLKSLARSLATVVFPAAVKGAATHKRLAVRRIKVNGLTAAEVLGYWMSASEGRVILRIVGILHPRRAEGVVAIANIVYARQAVPKPDDLPRTRGGTVLRHFRYLDR